MAARSASRAPRGAASPTSRLLAALGLSALLGGIAFIVLTSGSDGGEATATPATATVAATTTAAKPKPRPPVKIVVTGTGAYDPEGDGTENGDQAGLATDGNPVTAWKSERYRASFRKSGVGLVLDAGRPVRAAGVVVTTETPGYAAEVQVGNSATGPFTTVSPSKTTGARTAFTLTPRRGRYVVVWITAIPPGTAAAVNEVTVTARS